ncbi:AAA family ATPase [Helicobacter sp.]|uniref:ATP-dependent nuclease n=1 Tax=Helicobacter sp. TaxID=218 RepID=UPI0025C11ECF|nr:AAA family ATPase [Helicobacter sp.]
MLLCSADEGGKALKCFRILENKSFDEIKDSNRAIKLNCSFKVGEKAPKDCDDAKQLRDFLKEAFESAQESTLQQEIPPKTFKATLNDMGGLSTTLPKKEQQISGVAEAREHMYAIINKIQSITSRYNEKLYEIEEGIEGIWDMRQIWDIDIGLFQYYYETLGQIIQGIPNYSFSSGENEESFQFVDKEEFVKMSKKPLESFVKTIIVDDDMLKKHCDVAFPPSITLYKERKITSKDLSVKPKDIAESAFFQTLNTILNRNKSKKECIDIISRIAEAETKYHRKIEEEINKHLQEVINKRFNELYCLEKKVYAFEIRLDSQEVLLNITKDKEIIDLDKQSVGFRKFFNLYFNFLYSQEISRGDIVCIDEPENSLSLPAQRDLRDFLRDFGRQSGILFIIATHSPSMIDINHLDKVRIVKPCSEISSDLKGSAFINNISALGYGESDVLKEIFLALGGQIDFDKSKVIFVEGIADYNILTAYARIYAQNNKDTADSKELIFLPIGGLGADDKENQGSKSQKDSKQNTPEMSSEQEKKVEHLLEFAKKCNILNPILLVDDDKAGRAMKEGVEADSKFKALSVLTLKEAFIEDNKEFKKGFEHLNKENLEIEQLFSSEDRERFGFDSYKENKQVSIISSSFKDEILKKLESKENKIGLNKQTKRNFDELFKYLIDFKESNNA